MDTPLGVDMAIGELAKAGVAVSGRSSALTSAGDIMRVDEGSC
jgi:hypothetical protein